MKASGQDFEVFFCFLIAFWIAATAVPLLQCFTTTTEKRNNKETRKHSSARMGNHSLETNGGTREPLRKKVGADIYVAISFDVLIYSFFLI